MTILGGTGWLLVGAAFNAAAALFVIWCTRGQR